MPHQQPTRSAVGNLRWTRSGQVWADFILTGLPYGLRPAREKSSVRDLHTALLRSLPGESLLLGVCSGQDPAVVVQRMLEGVDLDRHPDWALECEATLDTLDQIGIGRRVFWLSVPLPAGRVRDRLRQPFTAAWEDLADRLALPASAPSEAEMQRRLAQAAQVQRRIPAPFEPVPATVAQMIWLHLHSMQRGLYTDLDLPTTSGDDVATELLTPRSTGASAFPTPMLDEAGQTDLSRSSLKRLNPFTRRFVKVVDAHSTAQPPTSYQSLLVLADPPDAGSVFPGSEILGRIDECGLDVDWGLRLNTRSGQEASRANRRALINLNEQFNQREGELSHGHSTLERAAAALQEYHDVLEGDKLEVEVHATVIFCVAGDTADMATGQAKGLADYFQSMDYRLSQPLGSQEALWWDLQPGSPPSSTVREFAQISTSRTVATMVPLADTTLGDRRGSVLALNISAGPLLGPTLSCGPASVIMHDPEGSTDRDVSGAFGVVGELGGGKSYALKTVGSDVVDRGGQIVTVDRTVMGEWAKWAEAMTSGVVVVDVSAPAYSVDPLRVFGPVVGARMLQTFLTPLLDIAPTSEHGILLSEVLDAKYLSDHSIDSTAALLTHLRTCPLPGSAELARLIGVFSRRDLGRVVFDDTIPALDLAASGIVFRTHQMQLPGRDELEHEHLFRQLSMEKIFGRAMYALIAAVARHVCFSDLDRLGCFLVDETHAFTISPEGEREIVEFVRDCRKHRALVGLGSHDPEHDFGSETLRALIPTRIVMRQRDKGLAQRSLTWLGTEPDEQLLHMLMKDTSPPGPDGQVAGHRRGECLIRDSNGNIGRGKILGPQRPDREKAASTSGRDRQAAEAVT